jgi:TonB family protein
LPTGARPITIRDGPRFFGRFVSWIIRTTFLLPMKIKYASSIPLLWAALLAGPAHAQGTFRIGTFEVKIQADSVTGQDRSFAKLKPVGTDSLDDVGAVLWACGRDPGGLSAGVRLEAWGDEGAKRRVAWHFDTQAADTLVLDGEDDSVLWYLGDHDLAAVTARARSASALTIQLLGGEGSRWGSIHRYTLAGLDSALSRLGCPAAPAAPAAPRTAAGRETLRSIPQLIPVEEMPRVTNVSEFSRVLARNYPPVLRDAGVPGEVVVRFRVLETGQVDSASMQVTRSSHPEFSAPALASLLRLRFRPARVYDRPVKVWVEQPITFAVDSPDPTAPGADPASVQDMMRYAERNYPRELRDVGIRGEVTLRFRLTREGRVDRSTVFVILSTHQAFNDVAVRAVQRLRYPVPAGSDGEGVKTVTVQFFS